MENEAQLPHPPSDGVTAVRFSPTGSLLLVSSWDSTLRAYSPKTVTLTCSTEHEAPVLGCDFGAEETSAISGSLDGGVRSTQLGSEHPSRLLGQHQSGVSCVRYCAVAGATVSGSWDRTLKLWDPRCAEACTGTYSQPDKVYALCCGARTSSVPLVVVATAARHVHIIDLRRPGEPLQKRESALKFQSRAVTQMPSGIGFALGSVEGRVAIEYNDPSSHMQARRYAFKCHRSVTDGVEKAYPVNAIAFHPKFSTFATGGCDGLVNVWDGEHKKRLCQFRRYPTAIAALDFCPSGDRLAIASSYTYEHGPIEHPADAIFVRQISNDDVKPKARNNPPG